MCYPVTQQNHKTQISSWSRIQLVGFYQPLYLFSKLSGFKHKELRGKLAIGITANFINRNTAAEAHVAEISGVARIYNQKFFQELLTETGRNLYDL